MKKSVFSIFLGASLLLGAVAFSTDSSAAYTTNVLMGGTACRWYGTVGNDTYFNPSGYSASGLENTSGSSRYLVCPIVKDAWQGTDSAWAVMTTSSDVCELWARGQSASSIHWNASSIDSLGSGYYRHIFTPGSSTYGYSVSLLCNVPAGAAVINYYHAPY